jgi:putative addiction module component (TIGR02574 family)
MSSPHLNLDNLSPEEKLRLLEELWDSLSATPQDVPMTSAQREELDRRLDELDRDGPNGIPWDDVLREIESRGR